MSTKTWKEANAALPAAQQEQMEPLPAKPGVLSVMDALLSPLVAGNYLPTADDIREARATVERLAEAATELSCDLEHSIALANFGEANTVKAGHPIRVALDKLDEALAAFRGEA